MDPSAKYYVYVYFRPNGQPCYVGKGKDNRWVEHLRISNHYNKHFANIIKKYGETLPIVKIRCNLTSREACDVEIALIAAIGRLDLGTGPLVNLTSGGEGLFGPAQAVRDKISKAKMSASLLGKKHTRPMPESGKQKIREARLGSRLSEEHKKRISLGLFKFYNK